MKIWFFCVCLVVCASARAAERPNILFIMTDDQAAWAVSAARNAHPNVRTPHIDRIYREGAYLPNAFTPTPVCSPSRASLMTGRYGGELGVTDWISDAEKKVGLDPKAPTWPGALRGAGYATGLVGKYHLGSSEVNNPAQLGFDHFMGFIGGGISPKGPTLTKNGKVEKFEGFASDVLTDHAVEFMRDHKGGPFCLSLHYRAPHAPWLPMPEGDFAPFKGLDPTLPEPEYPGLDVEKAKQVTREYLGSVAGVDRNVGRLLKALDELGIAENTVVVFTSDHGYNVGHHGIWHKGNGHWLLKDPPAGSENIPKGQRPNMFDHSLRVPLAVRWPAGIKPGTVVEETVTMLDWFPTLLAIGGVEAKAGKEGDTGRGRNFLPLLRGEKIAGWDNDLFGQYSTKHQSKTQMRMYRTRDWKLVRDFLNPGRDELYDLKADPEEKRNVINSADEGVKRAGKELEEKLRAKMKEIGDPVFKSSGTTDEHR